MRRIQGFRASSVARYCGGAWLLALVAAACSSAPKSPSPAIGLGGEKQALKSLDGRWEGTYTNPVNGRAGTIVFEVFSGGKEAHGDILMVPPGSKEPLHPSRPPTSAETLKTMPRVLEVTFVQAQGDQLQGNVGAFEDPECHCDARAVFFGSIRGETIDGTFFVEYLDSNGNPDPGKARATGTWKMARVKK